MIRLLLAFFTLASSPTSWELSQYADFIKGKLKNVSVTRDGVLIPGPALANNFPIPEASLWSIAQSPDGSIYLGTGPKGRIYRWYPNAKAPELFATLPEPHVFAISISPNGKIFAAGSPNGNIYQVSLRTATLFARTGAKFLWSLLATNDEVFAGSGDDGKIYQTFAGSSDVYYETTQSNITSLALDAERRLLAGSDPNGILYRITGKNTAQILYDAPFTEIRTVVPGPNGEVYFLAMGGVASKRSQAATATSPATTGLPQVTTTLTVTEEAQTGIDLKPKAPAATSGTTTTTPTVTSTLEVPGLDRSAIYRLNPDSTVDQLYVTKEESLYDLALSAGKLHFSSDNHGRIYRLDSDRAATLLSETGETEIGRILPTPTSWLAIATTSPKLLILGNTPKPPYAYESPVHEASNIARWGALNTVSTGKLLLETRSGNAPKPDPTWSQWQPLGNANIQSPTARYIQWRLATDTTFTLRSATLSYLPRNQPPVVKSLTAVLAMVPNNGPKPQAVATSSSTYTLTITDTGEATSSTSAGTASLLATRPAGRQLMLSWVAEDPDTDVLQYTLQFRAEDESQWKVLKQDTTDSSFTVDADTLADGRYLFRVTASDTLSNSATTTRSTDFTSVPVQLDQTPPTLEATLTNNTLNVRCTDAASPIRRMEYSINAGRWIFLEPSDGIYDGRQESATTQLALPPGESIITIRAFDASLNVALKKLVTTRQPAP